MSRKPKAGKRPVEGNRPWSKEELRTLTMAVGAFGRDYIARQLGRTPAAVYAQIQARFGGGGIGRGTNSLNKAVEQTGYDHRQLTRAGKALGQRWQRTSTDRRVMLSDDQVEALVRWLRHDYWCRRAKTYACAECGRSDVRPKGLGLCTNCYLHWRAEYAKRGRKFSADGVLHALAVARNQTPEEGWDWIDAFEASVQAGCVLSRGTMRRLLAELDASQDEQPT